MTSSAGPINRKTGCTLGHQDVVAIHEANPVASSGGQACVPGTRHPSVLHRMTRRRSSRTVLSRSATGSGQPSSTTISSRRHPRWPRALSTACPSQSARGRQAGMMRLTSGSLGDSLCWVMMIGWLPVPLESPGSPWFALGPGAVPLASVDKAGAPFARPAEARPRPTPTRRHTVPATRGNADALHLDPGPVSHRTAGVRVLPVAGPALGRDEDGASEETLANIT